MAPTTSTPASSSSSSAPAPTDPQTAFDHTIYYLLGLWPALTVAVANQWGGPASSDKREWLAGAISTLFAERTGTDAVDVEDVLLQVMADEFEVQVDDDSEVLVAAEIAGAHRAIMLEGDLAVAERVRARWERSRGGANAVAAFTDGGEQGSESEGSDEGDNDEDGDTEMGDAPVQLGHGGERRRQQEEAEVDEEGFTMVKKKGRR